MLESPDFRRRQSQKSESTFNRPLAIENGSIMGVGMNSTLCAGCISSTNSSDLRLCLRELDIVAKSDYKSLVLVVFNKFVDQGSRSNSLDISI